MVAFIQGDATVKCKIQMLKYLYTRPGNIGYRYLRGSSQFCEVINVFSEKKKSFAQTIQQVTIQLFFMSARVKY